MKHNQVLESYLVQIWPAFTLIFVNDTQVQVSFIFFCPITPDIVISIEDPFDQDDWDSWIHLRKILPKEIQVVGDDLTVTNPVRIQTALDRKACDALLLKINQIGTITESLQA